MDKTVGIIGLGIMGGAIARNLVARGWRVIGFDTDPAKCAELAEAHVVIVENVAHVVKNSPIIMTSLPTPAAVESVAKATPTSVYSSSESQRSRAINADLCRAPVFSFNTLPSTGMGSPGSVSSLQAVLSHDRSDRFRRTRCLSRWQFV